MMKGAVAGEDSRHIGLGPAMDFVDIGYIAPDKMGLKIEIAVPKMMSCNPDPMIRTVQTAVRTMMAASTAPNYWIPTGLVADCHTVDLPSSVVDFESTLLDLLEIAVFAVETDGLGCTGCYPGLRGYTSLEVRNQCRPHYLYDQKGCIHSWFGSESMSGIARTLVGLNSRTSHDGPQKRRRLLQKSHSSVGSRLSKTCKSCWPPATTVLAAFHFPLESYPEVDQLYRHYHYFLFDCYHSGAGHQAKNLRDLLDRIEVFDFAFHLLLRSLLDPKVVLALDNILRILVNILRTGHVLLPRKMLQALRMGFALVE